MAAVIYIALDEGVPVWRPLARQAVGIELFSDHLGPEPSDKQREFASGLQFRAIVDLGGHSELFATSAAAV